VVVDIDDSKSVPQYRIWWSASGGYAEQQPYTVSPVLYRAKQLKPKLMRISNDRADGISADGDGEAPNNSPADGHGRAHGDSPADAHGVGDDAPFFINFSDDEDNNNNNDDQVKE